MAPRQPLPAELAITVANGDVWLAIGLALALSLACWGFGTWVARCVGLLDARAPAGETLGVGLSVGLMVFAAWWAAIWSGGRSSFTPVAIGFALAVGLALVSRRPGRTEAGTGRRRITALRRPRRSLVLTALAGGSFVVAVALLYGATVAPSPRDGVQPVEFNDIAYYAVLGRDLATTGTESIHSASGFIDIPGLPLQTWYHWGELWLASSVIAIFGTMPMAARYFIVLPIVLLAAAALTGTIARRSARTSSRRLFVFGFAACLFLAPIPLSGTFFSSWPAGLLFGVNLYGLAAVAVLLAMYGLVVLASRRLSWAFACFVGSGAVFILPAHVAIGLLGLAGIGSAWALQAAATLRSTRRMPALGSHLRRPVIVAVLLGGATVAWGVVTGHSLGGASSPTIVPPFSAAWRDSVALTTLGSGVFLAIVVVWLIGRDRPHAQAGWFVGTLGLLVAGALGWGARLGEFTMFYLFYGGIAVIATPVAVVAIRALSDRLFLMRHRGWAAGLVVLCLAQLEIGAFNGVVRLQEFGAQGDEEPIPLTLLAGIAQLPRNAKLAYSCHPLDESGFGVPQLLSVDAHTARRVIPMCFEADLLSTLIGVERSERTENLYFRWAPQRILYSSADARPSSADVAQFLRSHDIDYIYVDGRHPNTLVEGAPPVLSSGTTEVLRIQ